MDTVVESSGNSLNSVPKEQTLFLMREQLTLEGCRFLPKTKKIEIPKYNNMIEHAVLDNLGIISKTDRNYAAESIEMLYTYLFGQSIVDNFASHEERVKWRTPHRHASDKDIFQKVYDRQNQLAGNNLAQVIASIETLADILYKNGNFKLSEKLGKSKRVLLSRVLGNDKRKLKPYADMNIEEKLEIVEEFEDKSVEVLGWLAPEVKKEHLLVTSAGVLEGLQAAQETAA